MKAGTTKRLTNGEPIFRQGEKHKYTYFILTGVVRASHLSFNAKEYAVAYYALGEFVGGPYFFDDSTKYLWSTYAVGPTKVLAVRGDNLRSLALKSAPLAVAMLDSLSCKIHWFSMLLQLMGTQSVAGRLRILLLGLGAAYGRTTKDGIQIQYRFTQSDLANMIGVTRQWLNNALGQFKKKGILTIGDGLITVRNQARLREAIGNDYD
jgi:CRP-like cAMP-binding protein